MDNEADMAEERMSVTDKIWIVMGSTGEYSDRTEWPVMAFMTKADAEQRIIDLGVLMQKIPQEWRDERWEHADKIKAHMALLDGGFQIDYTGSMYFTYEVPLAKSAT